MVAALFLSSLTGRPTHRSGVGSRGGFRERKEGERWKRDCVVEGSREVIRCMRD
jgi:hypothetical protein